MGHTQSKPKLKSRLNLLLIESPVINKHIPGAIISADYHRAIVRGFLGYGIREFSGRRGDAVEDVCESVSGFLAYVSLVFC